LKYRVILVPVLVCLLAAFALAYDESPTAGGSGTQTGFRMEGNEGAGDPDPAAKTVPVTKKDAQGEGEGGDGHDNSGGGVISTSNDGDTITCGGFGGYGGVDGEYAKEPAGANGGSKYTKPTASGGTIVVVLKESLDPLAGDHEVWYYIWFIPPGGGTPVLWYHGAPVGGTTWT